MKRPTAGPWEKITLAGSLDDWTGARFVIRAPGAPGGLAIIMGGLGSEEEEANADLIVAAAKDDETLEYLKEIIRRYIEGACDPGSGIRAILEGRLFDAIRKVDEPTRRVFGELAVWITQHVPFYMYGSPNHVAAWLTRKERRGDA
jgi:hypothetical protein